MIILSIGYGRTLFLERDPERARLLACAKATGEVHHIVFSLGVHALSRQELDGALYLYPTNSKSRLGMFFDALRIGREILALRKEAIVTTQDPLASGLVGLVLARGARRPLVVQEHGDIFSGSYWRRETWSNRIWYFVALFVIRRADLVRVVSKRVKDHVMALGVPEERIRSLAVFSDLDAMRAKDVDEDLHVASRDAYPIVLSVARFVPQKNLPLLLAAFKTLRTTHPKALLVLVGRGPREAELRMQAEALALGTSVVFKPWTKNVASLMKTADIYALSSNYEGWARVLPEAMACGLPAVSTDVGCAGEVFIHNRHGLIVAVGDTQGFGTALQRLASTEAERRTCGAQGREDTHAGNLGEYAHEWSEVYRGL